MDRIISQTMNGRVFLCPNCDKVHIEFINFLFSFDKEAFDFFRENIARIDGRYFEKANEKLSYRRKIIVPLGHRNISMLLSRNELSELKQLLAQHSDAWHVNYFISVKEIGMPIAAN